MTDLNTEKWINIDKAAEHLVCQYTRNNTALITK